MQCTFIACIMHDPAEGNMRKGVNHGARSYFGLCVAWELAYRNVPFVHQVGRPRHARFGAIGGQSIVRVLSSCSGCLEQQGALCKSTSVLLSAEQESFVLGEPEFRKEGGVAFVKHALPFHFCLSSSFNHERIITEACSMLMNSHFLQVVMQTY